MAADGITTRIEARIASLRDRRAACWDMALVFQQHLDFHGMHDMGVEIAALERAITELSQVLEGR